MAEYQRNGLVGKANNVFERIKELINPKPDVSTVLELEDAGLSVYYK